MAAYFGGCSGEQQGTPQDESGVSRTATKGPVALTLTAAPEVLKTSQHLKITIEILAETGATVLDSEYHRALLEGDHRFEYRIVRSQREVARPTGDGRLRWRYLYELEFFLPGEYELPPATVSFVDNQTAEDDDRDSGDAIETLKTEPVTVFVRRVDGAELTPEQMRQITRLDPVDLPQRWSRWWWMGALIVIVALAALVLLLRRLRRPSTERITRIPAHEWARRQLARLAADDLIPKGRVREFYYRISGIVRGYIERRFGVRAPEMTTEEFLAATSNDERLGVHVTDQLDRFLTACDLVKYARHEPAGEESEAAIKAAGGFVESTREVDGASGESGGSGRPTEECVA